MAALMLPLPAAAACFDLGKAEPHELSGMLSHRIFAGPPNFEDVQTGDTPEPGYILKLEAPICLTGDEDFADPDFAFDEVQLVSTDATGEAMVALNEQRVQVTLATPIPAMTGHHHRPLVAWVTAIEPEDGAASEGDGGASTVEAFYLALGSGDGASAAGFVIPEKTAKGPFSAKALSRFYGGLPEKLWLIELRKTGPNRFAVRYRFRSSSGTCDGRATVTTVQRKGRSFIAGIRAENGC
ncbi:hypothetical protein [Hoeflea marina]|nr:hypothetical protein [Hoeflea marina]